MEAYADSIGDIGVLCFLITYLLLERGRIAHTSVYYLGLNLAGAVLVMFSLIFHWNMPAFLLEAAWALISIYGIYKHIWRHGHG
jgi:hypothetical protein